MLTINPKDGLIELFVDTRYVQPIKLTPEEALQVANALMECVEIAQKPRMEVVKNGD